MIKLIFTLGLFHCTISAFWYTNVRPLQGYGTRHEGLKLNTAPLCLGIDLISVWKISVPFLQKIFPHLVFWWWFRALSKISYLSPKSHTGFQMAWSYLSAYLMSSCILRMVLPPIEKWGAKPWCPPSSPKNSACTQFSERRTCSLVFLHPIPPIGIHRVLD